MTVKVWVYKISYACVCSICGCYASCGFCVCSDADKVYILLMVVVIVVIMVAFVVAVVAIVVLLLLLVVIVVV
jgi:hypothetical protein